MRPRHKLIAGFFLRLILIDALLIAAWPLVQPGYRAAFAFASTIAFGDLGAASVRFESATDTPENAAHDLTIFLRNKQAGAVGRLPISTFYLGYVPTAMLVALTLATPIPWPRRLRALLIGLALVQPVIAFRVALLLLATLTGTDALATHSLGRTGDAAVSFFAELFATSLTGSYIAPILLWIITTLGRGAIPQILNAVPDQAFSPRRG